VRAVGLVFWAQLRHRWRSWLAIAILIGLVGGVIMAAAAAGRRTESAFPDFVAAHGFDAEVYSTQPAPQIPRLSEVSAATVAFGPDNGQPSCACTHPLNPSYFGVLVLPTHARLAFNLVSGRLPEPSNPDEVLASYTLQQDEGLHLGSVIHVPFYAPSQLSAYNNATGPPPKPIGPTIGLRVVGFEATEFDFPTGATPSYSLYASQAFARSVLPRVATGYAYFIRLRRGATDLPRFDAAVSAIGSTAYTQNEDSQIASVEASIHPQAVGWWLLAALAALVGLVVVAQALGRQSITESEEFPTLVALGIERRQLVLLGAARNVVVALAGSVGAVVLATFLSPIGPLGEARVAESSTGISFDVLVLAIGGLATILVVCALGIWPSVRAARTVRQDDPIVATTPSKVAGHLWSLGAPASVVIGVRNALKPKSGGVNVPLVSAVLGTVLAVTALCGTAVFGASLSNLISTPKLYGDAFQLNISNPNSSGTPNPTLLHSLEHDHDIVGITEGIALPAISIDRVVVGAIAGKAIRGQLLLSTVDGQPPNANGEVGLGATTLRQVGAHVGSVVRVAVSLASGGRRSVPFRVVAQMSLPVLGNAVSLGNGAVFTLAGYENAACPPGPGRDACRQQVIESSNGGVLASVVPGPRGQATINHYFDTYRSVTTLAVTPISLINFGEAVNFPLIFGAVLAMFGAATLLHLLVVSVSRRRQEIGLLKVVGFVNMQVASTVAWQATTMVAIGILIGVPAGVIIGRAVWNAFANNLGAVPISVVPGWLIGLLVAGVLVVGNVIALVPAMVATRSKPRDLLRAT
jgi:hypothetical protein